MPEAHNFQLVYILTALGTSEFAHVLHSFSGQNLARLLNIAYTSFVESKYTVRYKVIGLRCIVQKIVESFNLYFMKSRCSWLLEFCLIYPDAAS